ncbi:MAG: peptidase M28, partial [Vicinamibacterales bacterium]
MRLLHLAAALSLACIAAPVSLGSSAVEAPASSAAGETERIDYEVNARIRTEGRERSQLMHTLHMLTDRYGPRLTGSPNHKAAADWALTEMRKWELQNAHLEPW